MASERVLLIEDDPSIVAGLKLNLSLEGYEVIAASDAETGLRLAHDMAPDVILLDLMLPGVNGLEVLRRVRRRDADVPVIILTALADEADKVLGLQLGADDYISKPFSLGELRARITGRTTRASVCSSPPSWTMRIMPSQKAITPIRPIASVTADFADSIDAVATAGIAPVNAAVTTEATISASQMAFIMAQIL